MASLIHFIILVTRQLLRTDSDIRWPWPWRPQRSLRPRPGFPGCPRRPLRDAGLGARPSALPRPFRSRPWTGPGVPTLGAPQCSHGPPAKRQRQAACPGPFASWPQPSPALSPPRWLPATHLARSPPPVYGAMTVIATLFRRALRWTREKVVCGGVRSEADSSHNTPVHGHGHERVHGGRAANHQTAVTWRAHGMNRGPAWSWNRTQRGKRKQNKGGSPMRRAEGTKPDTNGTEIRSTDV